MCAAWAAMDGLEEINCGYLLLGTAHGGITVLLSISAVSVLLGMP
jgi:hypothetical protein